MTTATEGLDLMQMLALLERSRQLNNRALGQIDELMVAVTDLRRVHTYKGEGLTTCGADVSDALTFDVQIAGGVRPRPTTGIGHVVRIVGQPGSGKTTLRLALARDLELPSFDISDMPGHLERPSVAWQALHSQLTRSAIVESAGTSKWDAGSWRGRRSLVVRCNASAVIRAERLVVRPEAEEEIGYVNRLLGFREPDRWDLSWDGTAAMGSEPYIKLKDAIGTWLTRVALVERVSA